MKLKYLIFGILLLSIGCVYAETMPYWIEDYGDGYNLWVKVPYIPANGDTTIYVEKDSNYKPDGDAVFEFFDDFDGTSLNTNKWEIVGEYSMHDGKIKLNPNWVGGYKSGMIRTKKLFGKNIIIYSKIDSHTSYIRYGFGESDGGDFCRCYSYDDGGPRWWGFGIDGDVYKEGYGYDVDKLEYSQLTVGDDFVELKDNNVRYRIDHELPSVNLPVYFTSWSCSDVTLDYVYVRKYADNEPKTTIQNLGDYYKITIHNPNSYPLRNFQVKISNPSFITSKFEGLKITDKNPTPNKTAVIYIESEPSDANVFINGKYAGITPLELQLKEGTYTIKIKKDGYKEYTKKITLKAGDSKEISVSLTKEDTKEDNSIIPIIGAVFGGLMIVGGGIYALNKRNRNKKKKEVINELEELLKK